MASVPVTIDQPSQPPLTPSWAINLTAKEWAFVEHVAHYRNATQAYSAAYDTKGSYNVRAQGGAELMRKPRIRQAVLECRRAAVYDIGASVGWLLDRFLDIATADPRELIGVRVGCCRYCRGEGHAYQWREREYIEHLTKAEMDGLPLPDPGGGFDFNATLDPDPDCPQCHGEGVERFVPRDSDKLSDQALLLFGGVKVKADGGYEIVIADRNKALELAGKIMGAFTDQVKVSGAVAHIHAASDLQSSDPQKAAKVYREFINQHLTG